VYVAGLPSAHTLTRKDLVSMAIYSNLNKELSKILEVEYNPNYDILDDSNIFPIGKYQPFTWKNKKFSEEHKTNLSKSLKGKQNAIGNKSMLGKTHSEEAKKKISEASKGNQYAKGTKRTKEWLKLHEKTWSKENNGMYGKSHTIEARAKISASKKKQITVNNMSFPSAKEAAIYLNVSQQTMSNWVKKGKAKYNDRSNTNHKKE
jgi:hypothetical protein